MLAPQEAERRTTGSRALVLLGTTYVLSSLVAWSCYKDASAPASLGAPALALYVPQVPPAVQHVVPAASPSDTMPMPASPAVAVAPPSFKYTPASLLIPTLLPGVPMPDALVAPSVLTMDNPVSQMPAAEPSMDIAPVRDPLALPGWWSRWKKAHGPFRIALVASAAATAVIFFAIVASVTTIVRRRRSRRLEESKSALANGTGGLPPSTTILINGADDNLELGMLPARAGLSTMMAVADDANGKNIALEGSLKAKNGQF